MSGAVERIDKFRVDVGRWTEANSRNDAKVASEARRLSAWLTKHQNEVVPDNAKESLLCVVESLYRYVPRDASAVSADAISDVVSDFLKLPEGKLVSSKSKKKAIKWSESLANKNATTSSIITEPVPSRWMVADMTDNTVSLMKADVESEELLEGILIFDSVMCRRIQTAFDEGNVFVELNDDCTAVVRAFATEHGHELA